MLKLGTYQALDLTIAQALARRPTDFEGILTCGPDNSLASVFALIRMRRMHRLVVVDDGKAKEGESPEDARARKGKLLGLISLSDILRHVIVSRLGPFFFQRYVSCKPYETTEIGFSLPPPPPT